MEAAKKVIMSSDVWMLQRHRMSLANLTINQHLGTLYVVAPIYELIGSKINNLIRLISPRISSEISDLNLTSPVSRKNLKEAISIRSSYFAEMGSRTRVATNLIGPNTVP